MSSTKARPSPLTFLRLIAALLVAASAHGQEPAPLTTVAQVLDGGVSQTGQTARAVRVKGVVVSVSGMFNFFYLHEGGRCVAVRYPRRLAPPALGDRVEVEGSTMVNMLGGLRQMRVSADEFIITGSGACHIGETALGFRDGPVALLPGAHRRLASGWNRPAAAACAGWRRF